MQVLFLDADADRVAEEPKLRCWFRGHRGGLSLLLWKLMPVSSCDALTLLGHGSMYSYS